MVKFICREWWIIGILAMIVIHQMVFRFLPFDKKEIADYLSFSCNVIGGIVVLVSISQDYKLIKGVGLFESFMASRREIVRVLMANVKLEGSSKVRANIFKLSNDKDEQLKNVVEYIQKIEPYVNQQIQLVRDEAIKVIDGLRTELEKSKDEISSIRRGLAGVSIDGWRAKIFSVYLVFYAAYLSVA